VLDTTLTPELEAEGLARDLVRAVQQGRRDAGLDVSDRIDLIIGGSPAAREAAQTHERLIAGETLAATFWVGTESEFGELMSGVDVVVGDGQPATVFLTKAESS
jgi:isoleucyl-tRNA synthetase